MALGEYRRKRNFSKTSEPRGASAGRRREEKNEATFVIQEHHARRLHWDFRLEADGVLKSWAVTKEPTLDPKIRRLAIETEDHPLEYGGFSGTIPKGEYGAGEVRIWDHGTYSAEKPVSEAMEAGVIEVLLHGNKLRGRFVLVRIRAGRGDESSGAPDQWLFFKAKAKPKSLKIADVEEIVQSHRQNRREKQRQRHGKAA